MLHAFNAQERLAIEHTEHGRLEAQRLLAISLGDLGSACRVHVALEANEDRQDQQIKDGLLWEV